MTSWTSASASRQRDRARPPFVSRAFGWAAFIVVLATLATSPLTGLLALGYLLAISARVARGRSPSDGPEVEVAGRLGRAWLGIWLVLLPARLAASLVKSASVIHEGRDGLLDAALVVFTCVLALHIAAACFNGGRLRDFLVPRPRIFVKAIAAPRAAWAAARDGLWEIAARVRLLEHLWLGTRGALGTITWLALPVTLLVVGRRFALPWVAAAGAFLLVPVLLHLPFAQTHFAYEGRLRAMFDVPLLRALFRRAPFASSAAVCSTLILAAPLFALKIELLPRELLPYAGVLFVVLVLPSRLITGWAYARSRHRASACHPAIRVAARVVTLPIVLAYVLLLYLTQFTSWNGGASLYEQHAFLFPSPFPL